MKHWGIVNGYRLKGTEGDETVAEFCSPDNS